MGKFRAEESGMREVKSGIALAQLSEMKLGGLGGDFHSLSDNKGQETTEKKRNKFE